MPQSNGAKREHFQKQQGVTMCELMAMNSRVPTDVNLSLSELSRHGGGTGPHADGWGIAYAMGRDFRIIKEPEAAVDSDCVRYIQAHKFKSDLVISHIRRATYPKALTFENTHPFEREMFGRRFVFAHNGHMPGIEVLLRETGSRFTPLGNTDSEQAFCLILNLLSQRVPEGEAYRPRVLHDILHELSPRLLALGKCNFLLSDSEYLFAHGGHSLHWVTRHCPVAGDHLLEGGDLQLRYTHQGDQTATVVATVPLTKDEAWHRFEQGEIRVFHHGEDVTATLDGD